MPNSSPFIQSLALLPVDNESLAEIQVMLRERDVFTSGYEHVGVDVYDSVTYLQDQLLYDTSFCFRYDRNVLSRLVEVVEGKPLSTEHRVACGIQMLAQITEAVVEPNIALYELGSGRSHADANEQLTLFRCIDHTHPQHWADLATGRANALRARQLGDWDGQSIKEANYAKTLNHWRASLAVCLKIASLELNSMGAEAKMLELIRWMEEDLCFLWPGVILANRYLAPDARRSGLFKHLRSQNRGKALRGIRNQAWDLTLVYAWMNDSRGSDATDRIVILASLDRGLHSIARLVLIAAENEDLIQAARQQKLEDEFVLAWGEGRGRRLLKALLSAESRRISNPESKRLLTLEYVRDLERCLEEEVLRPLSSI